MKKTVLFSLKKTGDIHFISPIQKSDKLKCVSPEVFWDALFSQLFTFCADNINIRALSTRKITLTIVFAEALHVGQDTKWEQILAAVFLDATVRRWGTNDEQVCTALAAADAGVVEKEDFEDAVYDQLSDDKARRFLKEDQNIVLAILKDELSGRRLQRAAGCYGLDAKQLLSARRAQSRKRAAHVEVIDFRRYHPAAHPRKLFFGDRVMKGYFLNGTRSGHILEQMSQTNFSVLFGKRAEARRPVVNPKKFKRLILETAQKLGYSEQAIRNLSIHDAVLLSGRIVAHRLTYHRGMVGSEERKLKNLAERNAHAAIAQTIEDARAGVDRRNEEAKRIDAMPADVIFQKGRGICRNYSVVNAAVFSVIKTINPQLRNTYMVDYSPENLGHIMALPHAWNMVATLEPDRVRVTYVDPTWLATRVGNVQELERPKEERYNAVDEAHYGSEKYLLYDDIASLYEVAGNRKRSFGAAPPKFQTDEMSRKAYLNSAFDARLRQLESCLAILRKKGASEKVRRNIKKYAASTIIAAIDTFFESHGPPKAGYHHPINQGCFKKLREAYNAIRQVAADILDRQVGLPYPTGRHATPRQYFKSIGISQ